MIIFRVKVLIVDAFFASEEIAFHITGPANDRLSLNKFVLGIEIVKLLFETDRNKLFGKVIAHKWERSLIYSGAMTLTTSDIIFALKN